MLLFGEKKGTRTRRDGNRSYVNYTSYSSDSRRERERREASSTRRLEGIEITVMVLS